MSDASPRSASPSTPARNKMHLAVSWDHLSILYRRQVTSKIEWHAVLGALFVGPLKYALTRFLHHPRQYWTEISRLGS